MAFYTAAPSAPAPAARNGFAMALAKAAAAPSGDVEVFPENWSAFVLFEQMQTQWRVGFGGRTGLDYDVLFKLLDRHDFADATDWNDMFADIRVMELAALELFAEQRDQA